MKNNIITTILIVFLSSFLISCGGGFREALEGKKRSNESDEFLVKKKKPLQMPPDIDKMPEPGDGINMIETENEGDVKKLLKLKSSKSNKKLDSSDSNIIKNILEKIQ